MAVAFNNNSAIVIFRGVSAIGFYLRLNMDSKLLPAYEIIANDVLPSGAKLLKIKESVFTTDIIARGIEIHFVYNGKELFTNVSVSRRQAQKAIELANKKGPKVKIKDFADKIKCEMGSSRSIKSILEILLIANKLTNGAIYRAIWRTK